FRSASAPFRPQTGSPSSETWLCLACRRRGEFERNAGRDSECRARLRSAYGGNPRSSGKKARACQGAPRVIDNASLRNRCAIVGVGNSRLGQVPGVSSLDLLVEAMANALDNAGLTAADIDGVISRGPDDAYCHHQLIGE